MKIDRGRDVSQASADERRPPTDQKVGSELGYEADKAALQRHAQDHTVTRADLATIDQHADQAARLGAD
jgi:hypothetical protein